jgi:hypothetical protein
MPQHQYKQSVVGADSPGFAETVLTYSGSGAGGFLDETAVGSGTNGGITPVSCAIDVSQVKSFWIKSSADVTLKTNSSSAPTNTLALKAGIPYEWNTDSYDTFKLTGDVTSMFLVNAAVASCTVSCGFVYDATP